MSSTDASAENSVRIICGPTAAGKSAVAMALASAHRAMIISADSRQIYRGFDIGTAKPSPGERRLVPHRGIDVVHPRERYSAARWAQQAREWMDEASAAGCQPLIVGGTGFYLRALTDPLFEAPVLDEVRRSALERAFAVRSTEDIRRWCRALDPARAHLGRTQLIRAVETAMLAGERLSDLQRAGARAPGVRGRYLVIDPGTALRARIEQRVDAMFAAGWLDEVRDLMRTIDADAPAWKASGYGVLRETVSGRLTADEARTRVIIETRQYAKRQRTWFRHQLRDADTTRLDPEQPDFADAVERWWHGGLAS